MATSGKGGKAKGKGGELELMHILRDFYGYAVRRGDCFRGESDLVGLSGVHIECKRVERLNIYNAISDSKEIIINAEDGKGYFIPTKNEAEYVRNYVYTMVCRSKKNVSESEENVCTL